MTDDDATHAACGPHERGRPSMTGLEDRRLKSVLMTRLFAHSPTEVRIGGYRLERKLGQGSMGVVYLGRSDEGTVAAIKTLVTPSRDAHTRLRREAEALQLLDHPSIVRILGAGEYEDGSYVAMQYVRGSTLREWVSPPRARADVMRAFLEIAHALHHTHRAGLVHRDFKPDNVLVDESGVPWLLDFGLARAIAAGTDVIDPVLVETLTRSGVLLGTPAYAAPEQRLGGPVDARADQFSFAVSLYEALCGRRPFAGRTQDAIDLARLRGQIQPFEPHVIGAVREAIVRALSPQREDRFGSMSEIIDALGRAGEE